jgi:DNA-binding Xre family transcriptional regulator
MDDRGITVDKLHRISGVGREAIVALRKNTWKQVSRTALARICGVLDIGLDQLLELIPEDIWAPIRTSREVTVHYGSRALTGVQVAGSSDEARQFRQFVGVWDLRSINLISEYLRQWGVDIRVRLEEHVTGPERGFDPSVREAVRRLFHEGNHVLIGSPIANQFAEEAVCHAYKVTPYAPQMRQGFPYGFVWESARGVVSSFGWESVGKEIGIASTSTGKLVAWRTPSGDGEGKDCALILVYRILQPLVRRSSGGDEERVIIAILGHSGVGTYAAAELAIDPVWGPSLYPRERGKPFMGVVQATCTSSAANPPRDTREVTRWTLVDAPSASAAVPDPDGPIRPHRPA